MKASLILGLLAIVAMGTHARCPQGLSQSECSSYRLVEDTFSRVSHKATYAIVQGIMSFSFQTFDLYQSSLAVLEELAAAELRKGRLTRAEADEMLRDIAAAFFDAGAVQSAVTVKGIEAATQAQKDVIDALSEAVTNCAAMKHATQEYRVTKENIKEVLRSAHKKVTEIVSKALEKVNEGLNEIEAVFERMLEKISNSEVFQAIKSKVIENIEKIKERVTKQAEKSIEEEFDEAVHASHYALSDTTGTDGKEEGGITDLWTKITDAVKNISQKVYETTKKVLEEKKPQIMAALDQLGKVLVSAGKKIALELVGEIVKATIA